MQVVTLGEIRPATRLLNASIGHWKLLWNDVKEYVRACEVCQRTNDAKFVKEAAPLHPIPVKPKVWRQVCLIWWQ